MMIISRPIAVHWPLWHRAPRSAPALRAKAPRASAPRREGLGFIWYLIPILWLSIAVSGYLVLVQWPAVFAG